MTLYYYEELTLREIGEVLGVTESRVSQLHTKAILRLKAHLAGAQPRAGRDVAAHARARYLRLATKLAAEPSREEDEQPMPEPAKIRNVAVVGHRGTGKTSLVEALLFQSGAINRLGTVEAGTTVSDSDEDEHKRQLSIAMSLAHTTWQERKLNLVDVPGDPSFQGELRTAARVVEGALVTVSGVMGVEVGTIARVEARRRARARARRLREHARPRARRLLPHARGAPHPALARSASPCTSRSASEHELTGIVDVLHMCAYTSPEGAKEGEPGPIPDEMADLAAEYREKLLDAVVETDEGLMERYLDGQELDAHEVAAALKAAVTSGEVFPVACGVATKNLGTHALLDLLVEGVPSPAKKGSSDRRRRRRDRCVRVQDRRRSRSPGRINLFRVLKGTVTADTTLVNLRAKGKERMGSLLELQGKEHHPALDFGEGDIGAVAKLKEAQTGDLLTDKEVAIELPDFGFPEPVMSFAITPKSKGDEEKVATAIRRLAEEDQTLRLRRDQQTGEEILSGMSQMHVEVALERAKRRFGVDVELHPPRVPYRETIRREARAHGALQEADGRARPVRRLPHRHHADRGRATSSWTRSSAASSRRASGRPSTRASRRRCTTVSSPARPCRECASSSWTARTTPSTPRRWRSRSPARWRGRTRT